MAKFLQGSALNAALEKIIKEAELSLMLISPYIKLHSRIKDQLKLKLDNPRLKIIIVYGKSEDNVNKLTEDDLAFLKKLPNIEIRYEKNLHAKYYANENDGLITSMNLYDFSQNNNIEAGVLTKAPNVVLGTLTALVKQEDDVDFEAYQYFLNVVKNSELLYHNEPVVEKALLGLKTKYSESIVQLDMIDAYHVHAIKTIKSCKVEENTEQMGYCIRTGDKIPFNVAKPYSEKAFNSWVKWKNEKYAEKYCHFSGESSNGETCFVSPVLRKNWKEAKRIFKF